ncbi:uncharacterized protein RJT20DRAFT_134738 [Scheffersomyces xylosifermentans]|uniref:uncharacterized protein n=1 Tax=Scheffersomyces xylosifermentans TaxID=1304137 RepID=UPI00315CB921
MTPLAVEKAPRKRSRNGCCSCKKLRIKCDELKPSCGYCIHTNRDCVYPKPTTSSNRSIVRTSNISSLDVIERELRNKEEIVQVRRTQLESPITFIQLTSLNQVTSQLHITTFELQLLKFFDDYCMTFLSFGSNEGVYNVWKNYVPSLFLESELVRDSIYAFSAINMFPFSNIDIMMEDEIQGTMKLGGKRAISYKSVFRGNTSGESVSVSTTKYFMSSVNRTNSLISSHITDPYAPVALSNKTATELAIASILTFIFLAIHPHRLVPLVDFSETRNDYLSICKGIRATISVCAPMLKNSEINALAVYSGNDGFHGHLKDSTYPLIVKLRRDFVEIYEADEFGSAIEREYNTLLQVLDTYNRGLYAAIKLKSPAPFVRCISLFPDHFHQLIYEKNFLALRLLFIFAGLASIMDFQIIDDFCMWSDYMSWYKTYNLKTFRNTWLYSLDENFYEIVSKRSTFRTINYSYLSTFDPDIPTSYVDQIIE